VSVALVIQHVKGIRPSLLSQFTCLAVPDFSHHVIKGTIFIKAFLSMKYVFSFSLKFVPKISNFEQNLESFKNNCMSVCTVFLIVKFE
jgi:hypothetical protein